MIVRTLALLATLGLAASAAAAPLHTTGPFGPNGMMLLDDGRLSIATEPPEFSPVVSREPINGLLAILNNLATRYPNGLYWSQTGTSIIGPNAIKNFPEYWQGAAFTPPNDATVTRIDVAVGYSGGGTNSIVVSLNADSSGVPGAALHTWGGVTMPIFGQCCGVATVKDSAGIPLSAGQQYWIVVRTGSHDKATTAAWNPNDTDQVDKATVAVWCSADHGGTCTANDTWTMEHGIDFAFAVYGR